MKGRADDGTCDAPPGFLKFGNTIITLRNEPAGGQRGGRKEDAEAASEEDWGAADRLTVKNNQDLFHFPQSINSDHM